jgi:hypothetical protein
MAALVAWFGDATRGHSFEVRSPAVARRRISVLPEIRDEVEVRIRREALTAASLLHD